MTVQLEEFYLASEFLDQTEAYLAKIQPFQGESPAGCKTDFLGVNTDLQYFRLLNPDGLEQAQERQVVTTRRPNIQVGEQYFELGSLAAAIDDCQGTFCMAELGGGWGARAATAHAMINQPGQPQRSEFYVVVEAMSDHCRWIHEHLARNGLIPEHHSIVHAAVWTDNTPKLFPVCEGVLGQSIAASIPELVAGLKPEVAKQVLLNVIKTGELGIEEDYEARFGRSKRSWSFVSSVTLRDLFLPLEIVDYVDMDIQGAEEQVVVDGIDILQQKVKRLHIGTHGESIHRTLTELFQDRDWEVMVQVPPNGEYAGPWGTFRTGDGILSVVNRALREC